MNLVEFIDEYYPIDEKIKQYEADPFKRIMDNDDLPYDDIRMYEGKLQKVVYLSDDEVIPVFELLSYTAEDIKKLNNAELSSVYNAYMDNIDVTDMTIEEIMSAVQDYSRAKENKERLLNACIS